MAHRFRVENPHFGYFLRGHPGMRLRDDVEKKLGVKIQILNNADEVLVDGDDPDTIETVKEELRAGWHLDDFQKAREVFELMDSSASHDFFTVPCRHVSGLIGHYGRRVAGLESRSNAAIKIDCVGHVSVFGTQEACDRAKSEVREWIKRESGDRPFSLNGYDFDDPKDDVFPTGKVGASQNSTPTLLTFWVPSRGAALIIGRHGQNVSEFEKQYRCMIDLRTAEESSEGMVPIDITAKESRTAHKAKDEILKFLDRFFPSRNWPEIVEKEQASSNGQSLLDKTTGAKGVNRLTFTVAEEHAPRLIGTRGINKKRLEEKTDCVLILRTEERRNNIFPVDVIGRNMEECENAKAKILAFLNERPTTSSPPKRGRHSNTSRFRKCEIEEEEQDPPETNYTSNLVKAGDKPSNENVWEDHSGVSQEGCSLGLGTRSSVDSDPLGYLSPHFQSCFGPLIPSTYTPRKTYPLEQGEGDGVIANPIGTNTDRQKQIFVPDRLNPAHSFGDFYERLTLSAINVEDKTYSQQESSSAGFSGVEATGVFTDEQKVPSFLSPSSSTTP